ncbi:hypothetical protein Theco_0941 [Thermobacillus composti KWC4]|jgi:hypothetical protein|uniref:Uncharacterized protein n=1 Tax=Thermobacillus composti (strain DSM 18247 / JCM 13945 / KWC4) TaxID=717605 RepID=L0EA12_THECK|nr:hypothetical protein [Thermobacillus composti]AGA57128.1 hypothetical protein Theco_0941 [Thermobacillus composti KWC4]
MNGGVDLYLLAGVKTWPTYFREPAERLKAMSIEAGYADADVHVLYPYGDHTIPLHRQLREVARDVARRLALAADNLQPAIDRLGDLQMEAAGEYASAEGSPRHGAAAQPAEPRSSAVEAPAEPIVEAIRERSAGRVVVLIGHSGGGVAAYHAGRRLLAEGAVRDCRIVQIGSPKVRIHPALRDRTAYFYATDERGRIRDPITRLGTWGGIRKAAAGIPVWDSRRWAPGHIAAITIDGGHKDYFQHGPSGAAAKTTNLERTAAAVLDWLVRSLRPVRPPSPAQ